MKASIIPSKAAHISRPSGLEGAPMKNLVLGVDPGVSGAMAVYDLDRDAVTEVIDMPVHVVQRNGSKRATLDLYQLGVFISTLSSRLRVAVVEDVHAMPKQGVSSTFSFGFSAGAVQGVVATLMAPIALVRPAIWKRALGLNGDKDASRRKASMMFPYAANNWPLKKHDGRAEAALIAWYGARYSLKERNL